MAKSKQQPLEGKRMYKPMTVQDLRKALTGVPGDMPVMMADSRPVTLAEAEDGEFIISDPDPDEEETL